jgi:hypothetical protein
MKKGQAGIYVAGVVIFAILICLLVYFLNQVFGPKSNMGMKVVVNGYEDCCRIKENYFCGVSLKDCNSKKEYSCVNNLVQEGECILQ